MTAMQLEQEIVVAVNGVSQKIWRDEWRRGRTELGAHEVADYIENVRRNADCTEDQLPPSLRQLLAQAVKIGSLPLQSLHSALREIVAAAA